MHSYAVHCVQMHSPEVPKFLVTPAIRTLY